jgi:negative regulator of sigma E activity
MSVNWINKILSHEEAPPQGVWMNIANELDKDEQKNDSNLTTKILAYEVEPPTTALVNIFNALDKEEETHNYVARLYNHQEEPPVLAWENIAAQLNDENTAAVVPFENKKNNIRALYIRIAAAAAVIAIVVTTVLLISKEKPAHINESVAAVIPQNQHNEIPKVDTEKTTLPASDSHENMINPVEKKSTVPAEALVIDYIKGNETLSLAPNPTEANKEKLQNSKGETPQDITLMNTPNTYISIAGPDGQTVKVSSKFSNLISYLTGVDTEENLDVIIKESAKWKATFAAWRDKMTNNVVAPSLGNFMDIIELSKILEEKK